MKSLPLIFLFIAIAFTGISQHNNIIIDNDNSGYNPCEPTIIIDPNNTNHIVGGAIIDRYYYSNDAGYTWETGHLTSPYGVWGDPVVIVDTAGSYYYFHLSNPIQGSWIDRIVCQKADQIGDQWGEGTYTGLNGTKNQDKHWAVVDQSNNNIYVTWTQFDTYGSNDTSDKSNIMFSKSTDGGQSWGDALRINEVPGDCLDDDNTVEGAVPAIGPNGKIYVAWAGPSGLVLNKSNDEGETWLNEDIFIADIPGGWAYSIPGIYRCNGLPITKCDLSGGPFHGTIYVNWSDQQNGEDDTDIWLVRSTDDGNTWSEPIRVNDDASGKQQFFTWMDVDQQTGYLWFVWYDRRNYDNNNTDVYMACSKDGGETFTNFKVSESPFIPWGHLFFGDYNNVSAYNNVVRPIWTRLEEGQFSIYTAIVDTALLGREEKLSMPFSMEQNYPNPLKESTYISFKLRKPMQVNLSVFDMYGRKMATLLENKYLMPGKYIEHLNVSDYSLSAGIYYFQLTDKNQVIKRKMVVSN